MMAHPALLIAALFTGALAGFLLVQAAMAKRAQAQSKKEAMRNSGVVSSNFEETYACGGVAAKTLGFMVSLHRRLAHGATKPLAKWMPPPKSVVVDRFEEVCARAGVQGDMSFETQREARIRLAAILALVGMVLGACISNELMALMALAGLCAGAFLPGWALRQEVAARKDQLKRELPEMLEVVSLGISSGLTFDRSFGLYPVYFDTRFARECGEAHRKWTMGFTSREAALKDLARGYDSALLDRVVESVVRSMRFGTSLASDLARAAADSRADQKAARQEYIAKVPVRMMIPTACLILPAMLLLVLGPVLLELIEGF